MELDSYCKGPKYEDTILVLQLGTKLKTLL